ncbi:MAG: hypothetical protein ABF445_09640 [Leuconostoc mesenteroides]
MAIVLNIIIGVVTGLGIAFLGNVVKQPGTVLRKNITLGTGILLGSLGAVSADQLLNYGPTLMGTNFVPAIAGGIVLSFVGVYAGKRWLHLGTN